MEHTIFEGYEVPVGTSDKAKEVLRKLNENGVVIFEYDDGPDLMVDQELKNIAGNIGLEVFSRLFYTVIFDEPGLKKYLFQDVE
jgi:hypothetical protein